MNNQPRFEAVPDTIAQDPWSVVQGGALVYEFDFTEQEARIVADLLNENPGLTWEETEPLLRKRIAKTKKKATAASAPIDWLAVAAQHFDSFEHTVPGMQTAALLAIAQELRQMNERASQKPTVLLIPSEHATRLYDPTTGIQYTLRHYPAEGKVSEYFVPVGFVALNAAATGNNDLPHIHADGDDALDWWRQIVAHYREQNRIVGWQYQQAVTIEKQAGDILRQWTEARNDSESHPSASPSGIPF